MSDMLSQDEIDALLRGGGAMTPPQQGETLSDMERDALGEIGNISFGTAATALSTLLNRRVEITTPMVSVAKTQELGSEFPVPHVAVQVQYTAGFEGLNALFIRPEDARIIADLMMGGQGAPPEGELDELQLSAVSEAMNQMMGSAATSMSQMFNMKINISPPTARIVDFQKETPGELFSGEEVVVKVAFRLIVADLIDSHIMQIIPLSFAKKMVTALMGPQDSASPSATAPSQTPGTQPSTGTGAPSPTEASGQQTVSPQEKAVADRPGGYHEAGTSQTEVAASAQTVIKPVEFGPLHSPGAETPRMDNLDLLLDVSLTVSVELGRTRQSVREVLSWSLGSVVELDRLAGEPVDIYVNQKLIAKGEVVVIDENFGVRVTDIVHPRDRMRGVQQGG
ncbi:flagellar motor switching and energizing phosphatase [Kyrpidia spormannii]|uniref:Flagellar motor switching and energizing phosphatase n=1 Tax=Kyrpidia spormannii TaxID=2055160 RepID=A0ACA8Z937_9BACL|nr:flagellar motor switching and energizing phosphatase [Kyrpidia spormannii]